MLNILEYLLEIGQIKSTNVGGADYVNTKKCPWCSNSKLDVYFKTASFVCRKAKCGQAGKFEKYIMQVEGLSWRDATVKLNGKREFTSQKLFNFGKKWEPEVEKEDWLKPVAIPRHFEEISHIHVDAVNYLKHSRGISLEMAKDAEILVSEVDKRIIFPVEFGEEIVGYVARDYSDDSEKKVLNSKGKFRRMMMYNYMRVRKVRPESIVIVESAINANKCGLDRSVAILGVVMTQEQVSLVKDISPKRIFIFLDPGYESEAAVIGENFRYINAEVLIVEMPKIYKPDGQLKDAGDLSLEEADEVIKRYSINLDDFIARTNKPTTSLFARRDNRPKNRY